ncbi:MAG: hypothetical protein PXY39_07810 [archaeon]|nr:hypothetical protein [archaeon]
MQLSKRLLYSSLLAVGLVIVLIASSVSAMTAYGYSDNNNHSQTTQTGWRVSWVVKTGPAPPGAPLPLQSMLITGSCDLTGMLPGGMAGTSGHCEVLTIVNYYDSSGTVQSSTCQGDITLGNSPGLKAMTGSSVPLGWVVMPPSDSGLYTLYGITVHGNPVSDFRVGWSSETAANIASGSLGPTSGVCSMFLFDGTSADLFVPAQAGHFNFSGVSSVGPAGFNFGTFQVYHANVTPIHQHHHIHQFDDNDN